MATDTEQKNKNEKVTRPPIVVVMGHIDHGKTKLLDAIRETNVIAQESGGITQHIGAYEVEITTKEGEKKKITFIDTPGHEAFSKMRARGAHVADIAILVVAADDGVKPQTLDALNAIRRAGIPFIVAINKIDKTNADPERVKKELADNDVLVEEWGGKIPVVPISAKHNEGIRDLLEMILLVAELENLQMNTNVPAKGLVIESHLDPKRGNTATLLLTEGTLASGDFVVAGKAYSPVRIFENFLGNPIEEALPSQPVRIVGFSEMPEIGIPFETCSTKKEAEEKINAILQKKLTSEPPKKDLKTDTQGTAAAEEAELSALTLVLKADTTGSLEAIEEELKKMSTNEIIIKIIKKGIGAINEDDAKIAGSSKNSALVGFQVKVENEVMPLAERFGFALQTFDIIYKLTEWVRECMQKIAPQKKEEEIIGRALVLKVFSSKGSKQIVGGRVTKGIIRNKMKAWILRRDQMLGEGRILELQRKKLEAGEVKEGEEFGVRIDAPISIAEKDMLEIIEPK